MLMVINYEFVIYTTHLYVQGKERRSMSPKSCSLNYVLMKACFRSARRC